MNASDRPAAGRGPWTAFRAASTITIVVAMAGCSQPAHQDAVRESARYAAHAQRNYKAPGPAEDPWGPYIREASGRFDIPEIWVRSLMRVESGGKEYADGQLITSGAGAMGLMQVMPETYEELRDRYHLGDDPFDPHDNILSGVAYMREMYELYGTPGFLAAYNAGPARLDDYLSNTRPLPDETRRYVAMIAPNLLGVSPNVRSAGDQLAINSLPINIPPGRRYGRPVMLASSHGSGSRMSRRGQVELAQLPEPPRHGSWGSRQYTMVMPPMPPASHGGFHLFASANAAEVEPSRHGPATTGQWAIQVGAFAKPGMAHGALHSVQDHARVELAVAHPYVASVHQGRGQLWRARMTGMSHDAATNACKKLAHARTACLVLSPEG